MSQFVSHKNETRHSVGMCQVGCFLDPLSRCNSRLAVASTRVPFGWQQSLATENPKANLSTTAAAPIGQNSALGAPVPMSAAPAPLLIPIAGREFS